MYSFSPLFHTDFSTFLFWVIGVGTIISLFFSAACAQESVCSYNSKLKNTLIWCAWLLPVIVVSGYFQYLVFDAKAHSTVYANTPVVGKLVSATSREDKEGKYQNLVVNGFVGYEVDGKIVYFKIDSGIAYADSVTLYKN